jgi:hypothetical protein
MKHKHSESGSTMVLALIVMLVLAVGVGAAIEYTQHVARMTQRNLAMQQAVAAGRGALDVAFSQWKLACQQNENVALPASTISSYLSVPTFPDLSGTAAKWGSFLNLPGGPITGYTVSALNATDPTMTPLASGSAPIASVAQSPTMPTFDYLAEVDVKYAAISTNTVHVCRVFQKVTTSPWQYAIFYNNDLEINPGASFNVTGWVQTNGNLFTGANGTGSDYLNFGSKATFSGSWNPSGAWDSTDTSHSGTPIGPTWSTVEPAFGPLQLPENASTLTGTGIGSNPNTSDGYRRSSSVLTPRPLTRWLPALPPLIRLRRPAAISSSPLHPRLRSVISIRPASKF